MHLWELCFRNTLNFAKPLFTEGFQSSIRIFGLSLLLPLLFSCQSSSSKPEVNISRAAKDPQPYNILSTRRPTPLQFNELVAMIESPETAQAAFKKADKLFTSPFIDNLHYRKHGLPKVREYERIGPALRISTWNIEKSIRTQEVAEILTSADSFRAQLNPETVAEDDIYQEALLQRKRLAETDILLLQEMDLGHCRSNYLFAAEHLARKLDMNYVYAPQQLEMDPVYLGLDTVKAADNTIDHTACQALKGEPANYKGVFGVAVLSRFPIKRVQAFQLRTQPYDWYSDEMEKPDFVEITRRETTEGLFHFRPVREVKYGGRGFTRVDLHVPEVPHETISIINVHLEIKTTPGQRADQVREILSYIKDIKNPVVMAGDFNSAARDVSPTSFARFTSRTATDPTFLFSAALFTANITGVNQLRTTLNAGKNYRDPLAPHIPVIFPNKSKELFDVIRDYRFNDGGAFDFRGDRKRSTHWAGGELSNSNQRHAIKGYTYTFGVPRPIGPLGRERLDWIFVKSFLSKPNERKGSYQLAPHFAETLSLINTTAQNAYSDHHPITALLPLEEPVLD